MSVISKQPDFLKANLADDDKKIELLGLQTGTYEFSVEAEDENNHIANSTFSIEVLPQMDVVAKNYLHADNDNWLNWQNNLSVNPDNQWFKLREGETGLKKVEAAYDVDAIQCFAYYGGWNLWNTLLHSNAGKTIPTEKEGTYSEEDINFCADHEHDIWRTYHVDLAASGYKNLNKALKHKCVKQTVYHGFEKNELEFIDQINKIMNFDKGHYYWKDKEHQQEIMASFDLTKLKGQVLEYNAFCATSLNNQTAYNFAGGDFADFFKTSLLLEINVDQNTEGGFLWNPDLKFYNFDGYSAPLSEPGEYQLLLNSGLKLKINDAKWVTDINVDGANVLYIICDGYHQNN